MRRVLVVLGLVAASFAIAPSAFGACAGTQNTVVICFDLNGGTYYEDCVYIVIKPGCAPVTVTGPTVWCQSGC